MHEMDRRDFVRTAALAGGAAALAGCAKEPGGAPAVHTGKKFRWEMVTAWPEHFAVIGEAADRLAEWVRKMSGGRLTIKVHGAGKLVPAFESFDAVRRGDVQMGHAASYYWAGKVPAAQFFAAVPFGMNAQQMNAWLYGGGGLKLWENLYADFGLVPLPVGNSGVQMGGWFNREIRSVGDLKGLKIRMPGLGGAVLARAGATVSILPGGEIYTSLERGVIDAAEWVGPYHDYKMGFHKIAKYYYYPGWHEPGTVIELFIHRKAWEELDSDLKEIVRSAAHRSNVWMLSQFEAKNNEYLQKLVQEEKVRLKRFPKEVLETLRRYTGEVIDELVAKDERSKKVYESFSRFRKQVARWAETSEKAYYEAIG